MNTDLEQAAQRLHLFIHQLQNSVVRAAEAGGASYEDIVWQHAELLEGELKRMDDSGSSPAMALMTVFLMNEVRI